MADLEWKSRLTPVMLGAVELLTSVIPGDVLYKLVEARLLSFDDLENLTKICKCEGPRSAAQTTFSILRRLPPPSFRNFCRVLRKDDQGCSLASLLEGSADPTGICIGDSEENSAGIAHRPVEDSRSASERQPEQQEETSTAELAAPRANSLSSRNDALESREPEAKRRVSDPGCQAQGATSESNGDYKDVEFLVIEKYKTACSFQKPVVELFINRLCQLVYKKAARITYGYLQNLHKSVSVKLGEQVKFKIIFPFLEEAQKFKVNFEKVRENIAAVMNCKPEDVEILPKYGSCTLFITVTGQAFLNLLVALTKPGSLDFLYTVEDSVQIEIGTFPRVDLSLFREFPEQVGAKYRELSLNKIYGKRKAAESTSTPGSVAMDLLSSCDERNEEKSRWRKLTDRVKCVFLQYSVHEAANNSMLSQKYEKLQKRLQDVRNIFTDKRLSATELQSECKKLAIKVGERMTHLQLLSAAARGLSVACQFLLKSEVDLTAQTSNGFYALHLAAKNGHVSTCKVLIKSGARTDVKNNAGRQPLHLAALKGHLSTCKVLIDSRAPLNDGDCTGLRPLHLAAKNGHSDACSILIKNEAAVNDKGYLERQPLHWAAESGRSATCQILIKRGAQLNVGDQYLRQPLHLAAMKDHSATCELLIESDARVNDEDIHGRQPLHWAALYGYSVTCNVLIKSQASLHGKDNRGRQPLHWAAENGHSAACKILIEGGAELDGTDENKCHPLHLAAKNGHSDTCELLIERGARLSDEDLYGRRPLQLASIMDHENTCRILEEGEVRSGDSRY